MVRQRATQARDAFARVGTVAVTTASDGASEDAGFSASENAAIEAVGTAGVKASGTVSIIAGGEDGRKARRVGRPRGPERVALTVRVLPGTDTRLTAAVEITGESPQYIVEAALTAYFDQLGVPGL
jgi:hypothetical protein